MVALTSAGVLATAVVVLSRCAAAFNVDLQHAVVVPSPASPHLHFGYTVALTRNPSLLLVGEPKGSWIHRPEIHQPGVLYRCQLGGAPASPARCLPAFLDNTGNEVTYIGGHRVQHLKNDSMFASTIATTSGGLALVCGPGWKNQLYRDKHYLMNGLCYTLGWARDDRQPTPDAPLVENDMQGQTVDDPTSPNKKKNVFYYAFGEAGFSAHISEASGEVLLGAPGVYNWRGSAVRYRLSEAGQLVEQFVTRPDNLEDYGYFGYAVAAGRFLPGHDQPVRVQYAAGAPRASDTGKVFLFDLPDGVAAAGEGMFLLQELFGEQLGEYFGAALLAEDVNGDGLTDLLVGAPLYSTPQSGDAGRVFVYINLGEGRLDTVGPALMAPRRSGGGSHLPHGGPQGFLSDYIGARFGFAIAAAGDTNKDGYNDVWVGAPYEDGGRGAVYLFLGSPMGLRAAPAQRVSANDLHPDLRSFGFSVSAAADVDDNGYADLAVGAPLSGHAVVLLARPVARLSSRITSSSTELTFGATSFVLVACLQYTGHRAQPRAAADVTLSLDGPSGPLERAVLQLQPGRAAVRQLHYSQPLQLDRLSCTNVTVLLRASQSSVDYTSPIDVTMRFNLSDEASRRDRPFCASCPVLDPMAPTSAFLRIPYATGCANDTYCRPDLKLSADWPDVPLPLVLGSTREVTLRVRISNAGEPAFLTTLSVELPQPLAVARMPAACHAPRGAVSPKRGSTRLLCDVANPLNKQHDLELPLDVSLLSLSDVLAATPSAPLGGRSLSIRMNAMSAGSGRGNDSDSALDLGLPLAAVVDLDLVGRASPEVGTIRDESSGKAVGFTHTYEVRHVGPTVVPRAALRLLVPAKARVRGALVSLLKTRVLVDRRRVECSPREVTEADGEVTRTASGASTPRPRAEDADDWEDLEDGSAGGGLRCGRAPVLCVELLCPLTLAASVSSTIDLRLRLQTEHLGALGMSVGAVAVHTKAVVLLVDVPALPAGSRVRTRPVQLSTLFLRPAEAAPVQPWVVGLSVAAGLLLLSLLSLALRKAGFFGRKRMPPLDAAGLAGLADGLPRKTAGSGPADDDSLLDDKQKGVVTNVEDPDEVLESAASDSGMSMHSDTDTARTDRAWLSAG